MYGALTQETTQGGVVEKRLRSTAMGYAQCDQQSLKHKTELYMCMPALGQLPLINKQLSGLWKIPTPEGQYF